MPELSKNPNCFRFSPPSYWEGFASSFDVGGNLGASFIFKPSGGDVFRMDGQKVLQDWGHVMSDLARAERALRRGNVS
jgi:hypothetical protein